MAIKKQEQYGNSSISMLKGEDRVRKRPAVIFGSDDLEGCKHAVFEILSNAIDEAREGHGDIKQSMIRASEGQLWSVELQEIDPDKPNHIHLLIRSTPSVTPYEIVHRLKQYSTYDLWQKHHNEMIKWYWSGKHYCWTRGYFCTSIGDACISTIKNYIKKQG